MSGEFVAATGRRKEASASIRLYPEGSGKITVNGRDLEEFMPRLTLRRSLVRPLELVGMLEKFDVWCNVKGGGLSGQADAMMLGIARALVVYDNEFHKPLKEKGFLTRDAREKERKKYGLAGARKRFQFSKR
ncbi:30S ribosomal protein S9 [Gemmatimonadota bacterium]